MEYKTKLLIIGSGPAGYTAAIYAQRAGLEPIVVSGNQIGGQLIVTSEVENFPGFPDPILGQDLMDRMKKQAENLAVQIVSDFIKEVDFSQRPFVCMSDSGHTFISDAVIIATGATYKLMGLESEKKFLGFGVSACATCDGFFYRNKDVIVVGGGNTATMEAIHLSKFAKSVTIVNLEKNLTADKVMQERVLQKPNINIEFNSRVIEILGTDAPKSVTGVMIRNSETGATKEIKADGVFVSIGNKPQTDIFTKKLDLDKNGYIITEIDSCKTNIEGVFAAGDVQNRKYHQAVLAAAAGCLAGLEARDYLTNKGF